MTDVAIRVENLGKRYRIGEREPYKALRDTITDGVMAPFRAARSLARRANRHRDQSRENTFWALRGVSFEVKRGEVIGIIGRNGAGKSTLLKILSRVTEPTEGHAVVNGRIGSLLEVGTGFHPELTGRENIFLNGAILGMSQREIRRKFDEIVEFAGVEEFIDTPVKRYSSGMQVRLAFAVAAHLDSEILLLDEVLAVGDVGFQTKCAHKIDQVAESGRTILLVSHNLGAVEALCNSAILLKRGRALTSASPVREAVHEYVADDCTPRQSSVWHNSGAELPNPWLCIHRFFLGNEAGQILRMPITNDQDVWVHADVTVTRRHPATNVGYELSDDSARILYWSLTTDATQDMWPILEPGRRILRSRIPKRSLNEGLYRLQLIASIHRQQWISEPSRNAPTLFLEIQGGLSDSPFWQARRPGIFAPVRRWDELEPEGSQLGPSVLRESKSTLRSPLNETLLGAGDPSAEHILTTQTG